MRNHIIAALGPLALGAWFVSIPYTHGLTLLLGFVAAGLGFCYALIYSILCP